MLCSSSFSHTVREKSNLHFSSALSFLLASGAADEAAVWEQMDSSSRTQLKQKYADAGIKIIVSAFGSTETPTTSGTDAKTCASQMASWVKQYGLDGIDVDWEVCNKNKCLKYHAQT